MEIFVISYPYSGALWVASVLAEALHYPLHTTLNVPVVAHEDNCVYGLSVPLSKDLTVVMNTWCANPARATANQRFIFVVRNPKDVIALAAQDKQITIEEAVYAATHGRWPFGSVGPMDPYIAAWTTSPNVTTILVETNSIYELPKLLGVTWSNDDIYRAMGMCVEIEATIPPATSPEADKIIERDLGALIRGWGYYA